MIDILGTLDGKIENNNRLCEKISNQALLEIEQMLLSTTEFDFLKNHIKFVKGKKPLEESVDMLPYLSIDGMETYQFTMACAKKMILSDENDILMVMDGASSGRVYSAIKGIVSSTMARVDVFNTDKDFVFWLLKANEKSISAQNTGSAIPHTDKDFVSEILLPVNIPTHNLSLYRKTLSKFRKENLKLAELKQLYLKKFFG